MAANPRVSLHFSAEHLERQIHIRGTVEKISTAESLAYLHPRPRGSQIGAWASAPRARSPRANSLESKLAGATEKFGDGENPPSLHSGAATASSQRASILARRQRPPPRPFSSIPAKISIKFGKSPASRRNHAGIYLAGFFFAMFLLNLRPPVAFQPFLDARFSLPELRRLVITAAPRADTPAAHIPHS